MDLQIKRQSYYFTVLKPNFHIQLLQSFLIYRNHHHSFFLASSSFDHLLQLHELQLQFEPHLQSFSAP